MIGGQSPWLPEPTQLLLPLISSANGFNIESKILDKSLYVVGKSDVPYKYYTVFFRPTYSPVQLLAPSTPQKFLLITNRINKFMDFRANFSTPCLNQFCWDLINWFGDLWLFSFSIANTTSKSLASSTRGSAVCISVCLISLTTCTFNNREKSFLHLSKILWESATKSPFSNFTILFRGSQQFVNHLCSYTSTLYVFLLLLDSISSIVTFRYSFLLLEMSVKFTSYIV